MPSMQIKPVAKAQKKTIYFIASVTTKENVKYLIFDVPNRISIMPKAKFIEKIKIKNKKLEHIILFTENKDIVQKISSDMSNLNELLLLPQTELFISLIIN
ncbi:hypothetical protein KPL47_07950 [Clostridium estertheticum]|uniref:hypothetical protein n=1 Tax=Clostridium estertheticum TaxID=238834 RepID=UPI001C0D58F3|nr:hypothetical protein [Clostridium estertheticum]MBU3176302.1 hypothetical protein [Clostridium estertheticum]